MDDLCKYHISIADAIVLSLTKNMFYDHGYRCSVKLKAPRNHVMSLQFTQFDVGHPHMIFCDDSLHIYDGESEESNELTPSKGLCGTSIPKSLISSGNDVTLKFQSRYMTVGTGFQMIVTVLQEDEVVKCPKTLFNCGDGYCVDRKLMCDGYYNCLTQKDESGKFANCQGVHAVWIDFPFLMKIAVITLFAVSALTIAGLIVFFSKRRKLQNKRAL